MKVEDYNLAFAKTMTIEEVKDYKSMNLILTTILTKMKDDDTITKDELYAVAMNALAHGHIFIDGALKGEE